MVEKQPAFVIFCWLKFVKIKYRNEAFFFLFWQMERPKLRTVENDNPINQDPYFKLGVEPACD